MLVPMANADLSEHVSLIKPASWKEIRDSKSVTGPIHSQ